MNAAWQDNMLMTGGITNCMSRNPFSDARSFLSFQVVLLKASYRTFYESLSRDDSLCLPSSL